MITSDLVTETSVHHFVAEASGLGLPPGQVPSKLETNLGNGMAFYLVSADENEFRYKQVYGCISLTVFND